MDDDPQDLVDGGEASDRAREPPSSGECRKVGARQRRRARRRRGRGRRSQDLRDNESSEDGGRRNGCGHNNHRPTPHAHGPAAPRRLNSMNDSSSARFPSRYRPVPHLLSVRRARRPGSPRVQRPAVRFILPRIPYSFRSEPGPTSRAENRRPGLARRSDPFLPRTAREVAFP